MTMSVEQMLAVALDAGRQAASLLLKGQSESFAIESKGMFDLVTEYDRRAETLIVETLHREFPEHSFVGEEGVSAHQRAEAEYVWYIDPLDGTTNFAHKLPWYAVSIGLEYQQRPLLGVILVPGMKWEFTVVRGQGAFCNGQPLRVSTQPRLEQSLLATGFPYDRRTNPRNNLKEFSHVMMLCQGVRRIGAAAIDCAMVAMGLLEGYWERSINAWDVCAGALLIEEAGGNVTDYRGGRFDLHGREILATNGLVHDELVNALDHASRVIRESTA